MSKKKKIEEEHKTKISTYFDGELMHLWLDSMYMWVDDEWTHSFYMVNKLQFYIDLMRTLEGAMEDFQYRWEVVPQLWEEIGDISFMEYASYRG